MAGGIGPTEGKSTALIQEDLQRALDVEPAAKATFESLKSQPRFRILHLLMSTTTEKTRAARIARFIAQLADRAD